MDKITKSCVSEFLAQHEIAETGQSTDFEKLCNFSIVSHEFSGSFDVHDDCTDPGTQGIDGIAIIFNGRLIDDVDQVSDLVESNKCLEAVFVLVQAKSSPKFEASEMGHFGYAVKKFFEGDTSLFSGDAMANFMAVKDRICDLTPNIVLNNGVSIIAQRLQATGDKFTISDYQIVNGCQTTHVLFNNRDLTGMDYTIVPVRLIVTTDEDIRNTITQATNNQTEIKPEQLAVMFLDSPHLVSGYYGTVASRLGDKIFIKGQSYSPYYTSGLAYYRLETLFRTNQVDAAFKKARYHLLMILRHSAGNGPLPPLASKNVDPYCQEIIDALNDESRCLALFSAAVEVLADSGIDHADKNQLKQKEQTALLLSKLTKAGKVQRSVAGDA